MQYYSIIGCALTAWSPCIAILIMYLSRHPQLIMIAVSACFAFMIGSHIAALLWWIIIPARDVAALHTVLGAVTIEATRYGFYRVFKFIESAFGKRFKEVLYLTEFSVIPAGIAAGSGWAAGQSLLSFGMLIAYVSDPAVISPNGSWYEDSCPVEMVFANAILTFLYSICNIAWMPCAFAAYHSIMFPTEVPEEERLPFTRLGQPLPAIMGKGLLAATVALHLLASCFTLIMQSSCVVSIILVALVAVVSVVLAYHIATKVYHELPPNLLAIKNAMEEAARAKKEEDLRHDKNRSNDARYVSCKSNDALSELFLCGGEVRFSRFLEQVLRLILYFASFVFCLISTFLC